MFKDEDLKNHLETSSTVRIKSAVIAEWNMNIPDNIQKIGNYRYRPATPENPNDPNFKYKNIINTFDPNDQGNYYTNATDSDIEIDGGYKDDGSPKIFPTTKEKMTMLYSLEECFGRFRPRSGINKLMYFEDRYLHHSNQNLAKRPRYYMSDKNDKFKYWTSYRTETNIPRGISFSSENIVGKYFIDDAAPFIVYKDKVPSNRIVLKMQTHIGSVDLGPFNKKTGSFSDPFYGDINKRTPSDWKIQVLKDNNWIDVLSFKNTDVRKDGTPIIKEDGYVEVSYGLIVPDKYRDIFIKAEEYNSTAFLPSQSVIGYAYLIKPTQDSVGEYHIYTGQTSSGYEQFKPVYGWYLEEETVDRLTNFVTDLTAPIAYIEESTGLTKYTEFEYISGIRVAVESMTRINSPFDLIEISPRLTVDLSDKTLSYDVSKIASDLGVSGMPVGQLLASNGIITICDYDQAFNENNESSIISNFLTKNIQFKFYEIIVDVDGYDYFVPIKTMYAEGFPQTNFANRTVDISLRDLFFYLESMTAPELLIPNVSLSYAVSTLLDSIGFSNYGFKRVVGETELIIPFFFVGPGRSVAEVLNDLAVSSQTAMFFDEYNNFVMMSKNYMMPSDTQRETDLVLYGSKDFNDDGVFENKATSEKLANIIEISSADNKVYNGGRINYETKYIQKSVGSIKQASLMDKERIWIYKPALLWEVSGQENTKSINDETKNQSSYVLSAIPLTSDLSETIPTVSNNVVINNIIDLGEAVYWLSRYNGYFYANGEIIRFDAVEYNIPKIGLSDAKEINGEFVELQSNNVWITNVQEYQNYFSKLGFNGKIYPTGRVRIYTEPNYEEINGVLKLKNGPVAKHGRGQFGTKIVNHSAGLNQYWYNNDNVRGCMMHGKYLFSAFPSTTLTKVNSTGNTLTVKANTNINIGQQVTIESGTGALNPLQKTVVTAKPTPTTITISPAPTTPLLDATVLFTTITPNSSAGVAGKSDTLAQQTTRNSLIRNFLTSSYINESDLLKSQVAQTGTVQASALVMNGPYFTTAQNPTDFISYVYKPLDNKFKYFGTRMRVVGRVESNNQSQTPLGSSTYFSASGTSPSQNITIGGGSGGIGVMVNPSTNNGYYFELVALTESNLTKYNKDSSGIANMIFYKIESASESVPDDGVNVGDAIPVKLWSGLGKIVVDDGRFTGQSRMMAEETPTVYDIGIEYEDIGNSRKFYIYVNNTLITSVVDDKPLPVYNNVALFVRGSSRCMFEHLFALANNYSKVSNFQTDLPVNMIYGDNEINATESFRKYAMSGIIQSTYLSGISPSDQPQHNLYFEEFGTIMREAAYFNIKYDKAYPALHSKISPTFNSMKGYTVSGFRAGSYGAEFLIFNATDTVLSLDETTGNYLRIQGVTFTQQSQHELTVDEYFTKNSDFSNPKIEGTNVVESPFKAAQQYQDIKISRMTHGNNEFTIDSPYIQTQDAATNLMSWLVSKVVKPRKSVGLNIFAMPTLQLGDIVSIQYKDSENINQIEDSSKRFVVYNINYQRGIDGPSMSIYLSEVA